MRLVLLFGAMLGFVSVAFGAYAEHGLRPHIDDETFRHVMTAIRYNQIYAAVITVLGLISFVELPTPFRKHLPIIGVLFCLGTVLFSFSIYASAQLGVKALTYLTPVGGITLMVAWFYLIVVTALGGLKAKDAA
ncbi:MAG: DUF423 domain-containing protein [Pseudomonadota bacterium]